MSTGRGGAGPGRVRMRARRVFLRVCVHRETASSQCSTTAILTQRSGSTFSSCLSNPYLAAMHRMTIVTLRPSTTMRRRKTFFSISSPSCDSSTAGDDAQNLLTRLPTPTPLVPTMQMDSLSPSPWPMRQDGPQDSIVYEHKCLARTQTPRGNALAKEEDGLPPPGADLQRGASIRGSCMIAH